MDIQEFNKRLDIALETIVNELPVMIDERALNSIEFIKERFIQRGTEVGSGGEEVAFPAYSPKYAKYKEERFGASTPNRIVLTGETLRGLKIINRQTDGANYAVTVGGDTKISEERLEWNSTRYGDLLRLTTNEEETITDLVEADILDILLKALD